MPAGVPAGLTVAVERVALSPHADRDIANSTTVASSAHTLRGRLCPCRLASSTRTRRGKNGVSKKIDGGTPIAGGMVDPATDRAVVLTLAVTCAGVPLRAAELGVTVQVAPCGAPLQLSAIVPLKLFVPDSVSPKFAVAPGEIVCEADEPLAVEKEKSFPIPVKATVCGVSLALSAITRRAARLPTAVGVD